jgi:hypothetical protein
VRSVVILAFGRQRQEDCEFKASLVYQQVQSQAKLHNESLSQKKVKKKKDYCLSIAPSPIIEDIILSS